VVLTLRTLECAHLRVQPPSLTSLAPGPALPYFESLSAPVFSVGGRAGFAISVKHYKYLLFTEFAIALENDAHFNCHFSVMRFIA